MTDPRAGFFFKLGLLIFTTIFFSFAFAFGFVMPLLAAAGPSDDQFSIRPFLAALRLKLYGEPVQAETLIVSRGAAQSPGRVAPKPDPVAAAFPAADAQEDSEEP